MTLFVSYTRSDETLVRVLKADLDSLGRPVWLDHQIYGGQQWWQEIIRQIHDAEVFVFALSNDSWQSRPCRAELTYALQLGVPVVPVQVGPVESLAISIAKMQIIDYRRRSAETALALVKAVTEACAQARQLPDPLPDPPEMPFEYLFRISTEMEVQEIPAEAPGGGHCVPTTAAPAGRATRPAHRAPTSQARSTPSTGRRAGRAAGPRCVTRASRRACQRAG